MKSIKELIGNEATERLKERYGNLVDEIGVRVEGEQVFTMVFRIVSTIRVPAITHENVMVRPISVNVAEMEKVLYSFLNFGKGNEEHIHHNYNLPENGIHMHPAIYTDLMKYEGEAMRRIEDRLKWKKKDESKNDR